MDRTSVDRASADRARTDQVSAAPNASDWAWVEVRASGTSAELLLSRHVLLADLVPDLAERLGWHHHPSWRAGLSVVADGGRCLGWDQTLAQAGVADGAVLQVLTTPAPPVPHDDVAEALAESVADRVADERWSRQLVAGVGGWVMMLGGLFLARSDGGLSSTAVLAGAAAVVAALVVLDLRPAHLPSADLGPPPVVPPAAAFLVAVGLFVAAALALPLGPTMRQLAGVAVLVIAGLVGIGSPFLRVVGAGSCGVGLWGGVCVLAVQGAGGNSRQTGALLVVGLALTGLLAPRVLALGNEAGDDLWLGWAGAGALTAAVAGWLMAPAGVAGAAVILALITLGGRPSPRRVLGAETAGALALVTTFTGHSAVLAAERTSSLPGEHLWPVALVGAGLLLTLWQRLPTPRPTRWRQIADAARWAAVCALPPTALWAGGWW